MGIFDKIRGEFVDIVEWIDDTSRTLVWRFPRYHNQIKNGAQLIVRPGQVAIFVRQGQLADTFEPGQYTLTTQNLPVLSTLEGWKHGFDSPFKAEVYFVSTRQITDLKWGTPNPVMLRDADFGPVRLRAFGTYALRALDPKIILTELVGSDGNFSVDELTELVRSIIISSFVDYLGEAKIPALDLASQYREIGDEARDLVCERVDNEYGLEITQLNILNISLPPEVEKAIDQRSSMTAIGDMQQFQQFQMGNAMTAAANNPAGGGAAEGMGMGMGFAMAGQMMNSMAPQSPGVGATPPPPPTGPAFHVTENGQTQGPFNLQQMASAASGGQLTPETMVWCQGMATWSPAGQVPQLTGCFAPSPPPPPPPKA